MMSRHVSYEAAAAEKQDCQGQSYAKAQLRWYRCGMRLLYVLVNFAAVDVYDATMASQRTRATRASIAGTVFVFGGTALVTATLHVFPFIRFLLVYILYSSHSCWIQGLADAVLSIDDVSKLCLIYA